MLPMSEENLSIWVVKIDRLLSRHNLWLTTAESCTGGMLSHVITNLPGVSRSYLGGVISYANDIKLKLLGVQTETLVSFGAVSAETAREMAHGVRIACASREIPVEKIVGVSITGIAGPGGGSPNKPVGLAWIGIDSNWGSECHHYVAKGDRLENKGQFVEQSLSHLLMHLEKIL